MSPGLVPQGRSDLVERVRSRDPAAEEELVRSFAPRLLRLLRLWMRDREAARDIVNETLFIVMGAIREDRLREPEHLAAFVHGTARNLVRRHHRARARLPPHEPLLPEAAIHDPRDDRDEADRRDVVRHALAGLNATDRAILEAVLTGDGTLAQLAGRLGLSPEAVRARKSRAIRRLANHLRCHRTATHGDYTE